MKITLVSGNQNKLEEWRRLIPPDHHIQVDIVDLDLPEIQDFDPKVIVTEKVKQAYRKLKRPVVVEDVFAGLDDWNGLPGPFIKYFNKQLGDDVLLKLGGENAPVTVKCTVGYYDGSNLLIAQGSFAGTVVQPRVEQGFGFDIVVKPNESDLTFAEMNTGEKDRLSHRGRAVRDLIVQLEQL